MNFEAIYNQLVHDFHLEALPEDEREEVLTEISKTIQKQFLFDIHDSVGDKQFEALQASANMGEEFYATTLKHLVPNYEELFTGARAKILKAFHDKYPKLTVLLTVRVPVIFALRPMK